MPEPQAQRTLVKSPPELWAEISDVGTLARHLGEFGEIRITRVEPETTVAWEGDRACGTVELEPSGWGTKVTITAAAVAEVAAPGATVAVTDTAEEPAVEAEGAPEPAPTPKRGFLARLFSRRQAIEEAAAIAEPAAEPAPVPDPAPIAEPAPTPTLAGADVEAVLVGVLDNLGAAHHRPFSRG